MIQANELRIGNRVMVNGEIREIFSIVLGINGDYGFNSYEGAMSEFDEEDCNGIPLTPEILEKCGSRHPYLDGRMIINNVYFLWCKEKGNHYLLLTDDSFKPLYDIKFFFLHQLQNIHFTLRGEELEIKELQEN